MIDVCRQLTLLMLCEDLANAQLRAFSYLYFLGNGLSKDYYNV